ncbi:hypothetical protein E2C01_015931 [Portunus trituberculatus]|uniref:Uncharacterized protein n=1 Tax=Portunus trituberculatus TaxID=210409 RepID=A0A5B7DPM0_PORTR|nr:hypothetical protein [Portunus trituberculatus]
MYSPSILIYSDSSSFLPSPFLSIGLPSPSPSQLTCSYLPGLLELVYCRPMSNEAKEGKLVFLEVLFDAK